MHGGHCRLSTATLAAMGVANMRFEITSQDNALLVNALRYKAEANREAVKAAELPETSGVGGQLLSDARRMDDIADAIEGESIAILINE
jgi:hypothetical protein